MEAFLIYLCKASGILGLFYLVYRLFLTKETFFEANRHFLLAGILAAFVFPLINITRYITVTPVVYNNLQPVSTNTVLVESTAQVDWYWICLAVYLAGVVLLMLRFFVQLWSLRHLLVKNRKYREGKFWMIETREDLAPFSFFNYIFYNPELYGEAELEAIKQHEKAHCSQRHSIDVIVAHLVTITLWINPFSWLYRIQIQQNLEFLADSSAIQNTRSLRSYQYALIRVSSNKWCPPMTNQFYNSLIKKRIVMLHKSKSSQRNAFKFMIIIPLLIAFIFTFNTKVVAQVDEKVVEVKIEKIQVLIDKDYTDEQMAYDAKFMKERGVDLKFKGVKRNSAAEIIAINATYKDNNGKSGSYSLNGDDPIEPFVFTLTEGGDDRQIGFSTKMGKHSSHAERKKLTKRIVIESDDDEEHEGIHGTHVIKKMKVGGDEDVNVWFGDGGEEMMEVVVEMEDGKEIIKINGEEVTEEELEEMKKDNPDGKRIKIKKIKNGKDKNVFILKDSDDDHDIEVIEGDGSAFFFMDTDDGEEPLFIVDGKEMSREEFKAISPKDIETINVYKGEKAIEKYGDKAKDGVVEVKTKKN